MFDPHAVKQQFPLLGRQVHDKQLVYLDSAATSQKPQSVIDAISHYYQTSNANVHRGVHQLSDESTEVYEGARQKIAHFFGAHNDELILTRNTTEATNGVAYGWGLDNLQEGDIILTSLMEHHSSFVVWQQLAQRTKAKVEYINLTEDGHLDLQDLEKRLTTHQQKIKLVALVHVSNTLGVLNPIQEVSQLLKKFSPQARFYLDAAQSAPHLKLNFALLTVDFLAFSGHKMLGPMGIGGLLVHRELLKTGEFKPWLFGGGMIDQVHVEDTKFHPDLHERFLAGTPDVASAIGLATACDFLSQLNMDDVLNHDQKMVSYALEQLQTISAIQVIGPTKKSETDQLKDRVGSVSFIYQDVHAHDVAQILDYEGIAVRSGHHCTMPLHTHFEWQATIRASFQVYTTKEDIDALIEALKKVAQIFSKK